MIEQAKAMSDLARRIAEDPHEAAETAVTLLARVAMLKAQLEEANAARDASRELLEAQNEDSIRERALNAFRLKERDGIIASLRRDLLETRHD